MSFLLRAEKELPANGCVPIGPLSLEFRIQSPERHCHHGRHAQISLLSGVGRILVSGTSSRLHMNSDKKP